jgi:endonuclease/exonuclease/phosphatase (EEP) superfamily protein YafD
MLRPWSPVALALAIALTGCVSVPERQHALVWEASGGVAQREMTCNTAPVESFAAAPGMLDPRGIRVASWNVHKEGDRGWQSDLGRLLDASDVLLLQEAGVSPELRAVIEHGGISWVLASAFAYLGAEYGVLTVTRVAPADACTLRAYEPLLGIPKAALITHFRLQGRSTTLVVANLHAINFTLGTAEYRAQLDAIGDALAAHRGPLVLAGDFNTWNEARAGAVRALATRLSLAPVEFAIDDRTRFFGHIFDWIYTRDVEVLEARAWSIGSSDHNPIAVSLRVR